MEPGRLLLIIILAALGAAWWYVRSVRRAVGHLESVVEGLRRGESAPRLERISRKDPLRRLHTKLQRLMMSHSLRIRDVERERDHLRTIISNMQEGVMVVDQFERIVLVNRRAADILGKSLQGMQGKLLQEAVLNVDLQQLAREILEKRQSVQRDVVLLGEEERYLKAYATRIEQPREGYGALVVINDITKLRRLENVRRDFVANVSHELRTPITSIKGFAETLYSGSVKDPEDVQRFLGIISRQVARLHSIVEDLLSLSKLEEREKTIERAECAVRPILASAVEGVLQRAQEKKISIQIECDEGLRATLNASLIQQAVVNFIDNAITYSNPEGVVRVRAWDEGGRVHISVKDYGCGIERVHLPRLWERFYRVDRARSRRDGGTGLGLAIVKHIAQLHGGTVSVESAPGEGSEFSIQIGSTSAEGRQEEEAGQSALV